MFFEVEIKVNVKRYLELKSQLKNTFNLNNLSSCWET